MRSAPWRILLLSGMLAGAAALLYRGLPEQGIDPSGQAAEFLRAVDGLALVVPSGDNSPAPFFLSRNEVTNAEFVEFLRSTGYSPEAGGTLSRELFTDGKLGAIGEYARRPVTFVTAAEAALYSSWRGGRLPTIDEWVIAVNEAVTTSSETRWQVSRYGYNLLETGLMRTAPVGTFEGGRTNRRSSIVAPPVYDLIGNVAEWGIDRHSTQDPPRSQPVLGGSFRESTDRATGHYSAEEAPVRTRLESIGFRYVIPNATAYVRRLIDVLESADEATFVQIVAELRRFRAPLVRLLHAIRFADLRTRDVALDPPFGSFDITIPLGMGRLLRLFRTQIQLLEGERGVVATTEGIGPIDRDDGRHTLERRDGVDTVLLWSVDPGKNESGGRLYLLLDEGEPTLLDTSAGAALLPAPELLFFRITELKRRLPRGVLTDPVTLSIAPCPDTTRGMELVEIRVERDALITRRLGRLSAAEKVCAARAVDRYLAFGTIGLAWPEFDPACPPLPSVVAVAYRLDATRQEAPRAWLFASPFLPMLVGSAVDRVCVYLDDGSLISFDAPASGELLRSQRVPALASGMRPLQSEMVRSGALLLSADPEAKRLVVSRIDRRGSIASTRQIETESGRESPRLALLPDHSALLFDASGVVRALDADLRVRFTTTDRSYTADFAHPVLVDFDRDGSNEIALCASESELALLDYTTGLEVDRISLDKKKIMAILAPDEERRESGVVLGVLDQGFVPLRWPATRVDAVARRVMRALEAKESGSSP